MNQNDNLNKNIHFIYYLNDKSIFFFFIKNSKKFENIWNSKIKKKKFFSEKWDLENKWKSTFKEYIRIP